MRVKRVSYFTFIVAITAIATVSSCHKAKALTLATPENKQTNCFAAYGDLPAAIVQSPDNTLQLVKCLGEKKLLSGKFQVIKEYSEQGEVLNICFVFDKDYKGEVSSALFNTEHSSGITLLSYDAGILYPGSDVYATLDKRDDIYRKNRILLE